MNVVTTSGVMILNHFSLDGFQPGSNVIKLFLAVIYTFLK
jgi:hypothetical protein